MIICVGTLDMSRETYANVEERLIELTRSAREENGCEGYDIGRDIADPDRITITERWADRDALDAHLEGPAMQAFQSATEDAGDVAINVTVFEAGDGEPFGG